MKQPVVIMHDPMYMVEYNLGAAAFVAATLLEVGDFVVEDTGVVLMDAVTEDVALVGISAAKTNTLQALTTKIPVYMKCIIEVDVTSAAYALGDALKYTSKNTLVADADANTIAWVFDYSTATRTRIQALINVPNLGIVADKTFEKVSA